MNPFLVPGPENDPGRPLCPWEPDLTCHADYYVDVDDTSASYRTFQREMADGASLAPKGRLVVVMGQEGCGKTSMINRCAHWLQDELRPRGVEARIIDLTALPLENQPVPERMARVSERFVDQLVLADVFAADRPPLDIRERRSEWQNVYYVASQLLDSKFALLVLLPPIVLLPATPGLVSEISTYAGLAHKRIVFFAEVTLPSDDVDIVPAIQHTPPPIRLKVTTLTGDDSVLFGSDRLARHQDVGNYPKMDNDTLRLAVPRPLPIRYLQKVLYGVYELRRMSNDRYSREYEIKYAEIADYVYRDLWTRSLGT